MILSALVLGVTLAALPADWSPQNRRELRRSMGRIRRKVSPTIRSRAALCGVRRRGTALDLGLFGVAAEQDHGVADQSDEHGAADRSEFRRRGALVGRRAHPDLHQLVRGERLVERAQHAGREAVVADPYDGIESLRARAQESLLEALEFGSGRGGVGHGALKIGGDRGHAGWI